MSRAVPAYLPIAAGFVFVATWMLTPAPRGSVAASGVAASSPAFPEARGRRPIPAAWAAAKPEDPSPGEPPAPAAAAGSAREASVYYGGCNEVRAAGAAPLYRGQPGYRPGMDGDGDGIACEPHR